MVAVSSSSLSLIKMWFPRTILFGNFCSFKLNGGFLIWLHDAIVFGFSFYSATGESGWNKDYLMNKYCGFFVSFMVGDVNCCFVFILRGVSKVHLYWIGPKRWWKVVELSLHFRVMIGGRTLCRTVPCFHGFIKNGMGRVVYLSRRQLFPDNLRILLTKHKHFMAGHTYSQTRHWFSII